MRYSRYTYRARRPRRRWRLILDNINNASFLLKTLSHIKDGQTGHINEPNPLRLVDYLPTCENGSILLTTRSKGAALKLIKPSDIILVEPINQKEAKALIETKLGLRQDKVCIAALAIALECMPLAIVQATAYISRRAPQWSVQQYLEHFKQSDPRKAGLLRYEGGHLRRDVDAKNSIIITWQISFDHIRQSRPSAADLLALMSFFDRQGIPKSILRDRREGRRVGRGESIGRTSTFDDDVLLLQDYSFVQASENADNFQMHRLVQLATRRWLQDSGSHERWKEEFISRLSAHLPTGEYENWATWQMLLPHARLAHTLRPEIEASIIDWASVLYLMGWYLWRMGNGHEAESVSTLAMELRIEILGKGYGDSLNSMAIVGSAYRLNGRWEAAEKLEVEVIETRKQKLGPDYLNTLTSMANLASTYRNQGR
ncbi:hypothetical protein PG997_000105 [Apiospora hydei]|uniref:DUF7779 domain-containing protein n=1 Tax=Apiospora hydei TaxID=1337664 RepID=A0ABR1X9V3_9PEZI